MIAHDRYGGGGVMVLGGITVTGSTEFHICRGNVTGLYCKDKVIEFVVVLYARRHGNAVIFQDDKARARRAPVVQDHMQVRRTTNLPWPAKSADLFPVKHLWDILGRRVPRRPHKHRTSTS